MVEILKVLSAPIRFLVLVGLVGLASCENSDQNRENINQEEFVSLEDSGFMMHGEKFFPMMINYVADFRLIDDAPVLAVHYLYEEPDSYEYFSMDSIKLQRSEHLKLIKEMGFNTVRLCLDRVSVVGEKIGYRASDDYLYLNEDNDQIFSAIKEFVLEAEEQGLKIMMLIPPPVRDEVVEEYTISMLKYFEGTHSIFSYDFNNEPLYDRGHSEIPKPEVFEIVSEWKEWMEKYAPYQLLTIGYSEPIEVFSWDPSLLPVDFLSFHTYNPMRVPNEMYWYANYTGKPWMIGETALRVDDQEFPYEWQGDYMEAAFERTLALGGIGFGWWGFQEVPKIDWAEESTGLMTTEGMVYTSDSLLPIKGTFKPAVTRIKTLDFSKNPGSAERKINYFNMLGYSNYVLKGKLVDENERPIEGGCIRGWNEFYTIGQNTFSDENGNFTLYSNDDIFHLMISAPRKETKQFHEKITYSPTSPEVKEETNLPDRNLEYQSIDYREYLSFDSLKENPLFFEYKEDLFHNAAYSSSLGVIELQPWDYTQ